MKIYLVGGAVRDQLLGLPVRERDWVVVGAEEQDLMAKGFRRLDAEFPVFVHPDTGDEYALARTERKTGPGYKGFEVDAGPRVTLEQDLRRRDLTINALALDEGGGLVDLLGGREDLDAGLLRPAAIGDRIWRDNDNDGIQDAGEPGIANVTVTPSGAESQTTTTAAASAWRSSPGPRRRQR